MNDPITLTGRLPDGTEVLVTIFPADDEHPTSGELAHRTGNTWGIPVILSCTAEPDREGGLPRE